MAMHKQYSTQRCIAILEISNPPFQSVRRKTTLYRHRGISVTVYYRGFNIRVSLITGPRLAQVSIWHYKQFVAVFMTRRFIPFRPTPRHAMVAHQRQVSASSHLNSFQIQFFLDARQPSWLARRRRMAGFAQRGRFEGSRGDRAPQ